MIEYIYTDDLKQPDDLNSVDLMLLADKYNVVGLRRKCEKAISKNLNLGEANVNYPRYSLGRQELGAFLPLVRKFAHCVGVYFWQFYSKIQK
jgi:hypothetical protein